jgi:hypothetical protein
MSNGIKIHNKEKIQPQAPIQVLEEEVTDKNYQDHVQ